MNAITTAAAGMTAAAARLDIAASRIASGGADADLVAGVVDQAEAGAAFRADAAVARTADQMTGALLDILA